MVCSDTSAVHSIITIKQDEDKILPIDSHKLFCIAGEAGDRVQFSDYIIANVKLYALRNATSLSTKSVAHYTRGELATALRKVRKWCKAPVLASGLRACCGSRHTAFLECVGACLSAAAASAAAASARQSFPSRNQLMHTHKTAFPVPVPQSPYQCNLLVAGYDKDVGASLYWLDYLATLHKVNTGGTGYGEHSSRGCRRALGSWLLSGGAGKRRAPRRRPAAACAARCCRACPAWRPHCGRSPTDGTCCCTHAAVPSRPQAPTSRCRCLTSCGTPTSPRLRRCR